jgi:hypothetical protein
MTKIFRGFTIRVHRVGDPVYEDRKIDTWAEKGRLPGEWEQVKNDPDVDEAELYRSSQRRVRADRRRILDRHGR